MWHYSHNGDGGAQMQTRLTTSNHLLNLFMFWPTYICIYYKQTYKDILRFSGNLLLVLRLLHISSYEDIRTETYRHFEKPT